MPWVRRNLKQIVLMVALTILAVFWLLPILWAVSTSLKPNPHTYRHPPRWIPEVATLENFREVFFTIRTTPIWRAYYNSLIVAICTTFLVLVVSSLAAYALARLDFPGRNVVFAIIVSSLLIPGQITLIPVFLRLHRWGWLNSYKALIVPALAGPFAVFLLRQFMLSVPRDLEDAARIDGCSRFRIFYTIVLPLIKPALTTLAIFTFFGSWNDFMWPLIVMTRRDMMTLPVALQAYLAAFNYMIEAGYILAASVAATLPPAVFFLIFRRYIIKGIALSGLKF
ncbi:MAG TPA: carbohydrate ABC transporter permease [Firmicutes bacterium]|nr:carbohydrate ABC transporter permease [Bacillota bacterium]